MKTKQNTQEKEIKTIESADYIIKALPSDGKDWKDTNKIQVALTIKLGDVDKTFKGIVDLFGIIRRSN